MSSVFSHYLEEDANSLKRNILKSCQETLKDDIRIDLQTTLDDWKKENRKIKPSELLEIGKAFLFEFDFEDPDGKCVSWYEDYKNSVCNQIDNFFKNFKEVLLRSVDKKMMHEASELIQYYNDLIEGSQCFELFQRLLEIIGEELYAELENRLSSKDINESIQRFLKESPLGVEKKDILERFLSYNTHLINLALKKCHAVLILKKYYHRDNISDYQEMADILLDVISRQFSQNGNYTSAQQLYNEVRPKLDDFFFYNNAFDSRQEVYDLAVHLFEQEKYKGNSFIFLNNMHIWKEEPNYPKDFHGLLIKYARDHGNVFTREVALAYLEQIGSATPVQTFSNVLFKTGSKSFLQYDENQFVLAEALHINEYFIASVSAQIENLLEGEDYIATGEIDDYFYTTLPALPIGIFWSALLVEDVLRIYETDFTTIEAGKDNDKKTVPAAIVRKKSHYRSFSDVVWNEVSKSFLLPKEFTASEFREFLLNKGFIRGSEKKWNVHKTVAGDIRFYWTDNNGRVTIN